MTTAFQENAFQIDAFQIDAGVVVIEEVRGRGNWKLLKKNRPQQMRYSDLEARKAAVIARKAYSTPEPKTTFNEPESPLEDDEDDIILAVIRMLH